MAKATHIPPEIKMITEEKFILELSRKEAITLRKILARIAGDDVYSPRKFADSISFALSFVGVPSVELRISENERSIRFEKDETFVKE